MPLCTASFCFAAKLSPEMPLSSTVSEIAALLNPGNAAERGLVVPLRLRFVWFCWFLSRGRGFSWPPSRAGMLLPFIHLPITQSGTQELTSPANTQPLSFRVKRNIRVFRAIRMTARALALFPVRWIALPAVLLAAAVPAPPPAVLNGFVSL